VNFRTLSLVGFVVSAALLRLLPHPWNFTPITAMALFSGAHFRTRGAAFAIPLAALFLSDILLGFYSTMFVTYFSFALVVLMGMVFARTRSWGTITVTAVSSSLLFFVVSNFGVWLFDGLYPRNAQGLVACYTAALPFFQGTLVGDLVYTLSFFGLFRLAETRVPAIRHTSSI
jgi:hypothetical protein